MPAYFFVYEFLSKTKDACISVEQVSHAWLLNSDPKYRKYIEQLLERQLNIVHF